jgi:hypothetical protein
MKELLVETHKLALHYLYVLNEFASMQNQLGQVLCYGVTQEALLYYSIKPLYRGTLTPSHHEFGERVGCPLA